MKRLLWIASIAVFCVVAPPAATTVTASQAERTATGDALLQQFTKSEAQHVPSPSTDDQHLPRVAKAQEDYFVFVYRNRQLNLQWQLASTVIIFVVVIAIVAIGIVLAILQFRQDGARKTRTEPASSNAAGPPDTDAAEAAPVTEFEASLTGFKVSSPVLGVVILAMSMVFFYLYVTQVYPISEISRAPESASTPAPSQK